MNVFGRNYPHEWSLYDAEPKAGDVLYQAAEFFKHDGAHWVKLEGVERKRLDGRGDD